MSENGKSSSENKEPGHPMNRKVTADSHTDKVDLLKHFYKGALKEIDFLRKRQDNIFVWSSGVLVILIGALLLVESTKSPVWYSYGIWGKVVASLAVICFAGFSVIWQQRNREWHRENAEVATKIADILHCFEEGYFDPKGTALFPERWETRGKESQTFWKRVWRVNYVSATILLGLLAIGMIWVG